MTQTKTDKVELNLYEKLCAIMGEVDNIPKTGYNTFHKYHYVKESDVATHMRKLFSKYEVLVLSTTKSIHEELVDTKNGKATFIRVEVVYTMINANKPDEKEVSTFYGDALDSSGDKAIYKALTGCHKYFLIRTFNLGSDDDPENHTAAHEEGKANATSTSYIASDRTYPSAPPKTNANVKLVSIKAPKEFWDKKDPKYKEVARHLKDIGFSYSSTKDGGDGQYWGPCLINDPKFVWFNEFVTSGKSETTQTTLPLANGVDSEEFPF